ncbi:hypothetical protein Q4025_15365 [Acinetobacter baumannii]
MPNQINSKNTPKIYDAGDMADVYSEMLERSESIGYMLQVLQNEITLLPKLTGLEEVYFQSITRCFGVLDQLSYDNMQKLAQGEKRLSAEWEKMKGGSHNA